MLKTPLPPEEFVRFVRDEFPGCFRELDSLIAPVREDLPEWCALPLHIGADWLYARQDAVFNEVDCLAVISAYSWRLGKVVLRFDETVARQLLSSPVDEIPHEAFLKLPFVCPYILFDEPIKRAFKATLSDEVIQPHSLLDAKGMFVYLDYDVKTQTPGLQMVLDRPGAQSIILPICIRLEKKSVSVVVDELMAELGLRGEMLKRRGRLVKEGLGALASLVLYLCVGNRDLSEEGKAVEVEKAPLSVRRVKKKKKGKKEERPVIDAASNTSTFDVGYRIGKALRPGGSIHQAMEDARREREKSGSGREVTPHFRKHHFHPYRVGRRIDENGNRIPPCERELIVHFIPTTPVGMKLDDLFEQIKPVVRRVL